ncbi:helix-turn-helix transcriptional regulator [Bradyrhizobium sp. WSM 1704]|uniref:helix-turn-helix domain-containing protein n=1 Tax=Bradyrhizobium semiaridum TaxID=2821404 RepID=UPI001CE37299|nr:helix-turn-helix transcriptional regulator [Bradyrhizobium semiaridum]MCA6122118.1 helix-turn-helix transcriptional regulator [Bradyrhizobium semiaridum]
MTAGKNDLGIIGVVADNVRALRKAAELSQEELAHEAGLDRTYISQVERRQRNVTIVVLAKIAKALNVTPDKLLLVSSSRRKGP